MPAYDSPTQALDLFNTAIVSPIYYVMFTTLTVTANVILFQVCTCAAAADQYETSRRCTQQASEPGVHHCSPLHVMIFEMRTTHVPLLV